MFMGADGRLFCHYIIRPGKTSSSPSNNHHNISAYNWNEYLTLLLNSLMTNMWEWKLQWHWCTQRQQKHTCLHCIIGLGWFPLGESLTMTSTMSLLFVWKKNLVMYFYINFTECFILSRWACMFWGNTLIYI